jgi:hypothetical protein
MAAVDHLVYHFLVYIACGCQLVAAIEYCSLDYSLTPGLQTYLGQSVVLPNNAKKGLL